jgi:hypothetical protein
MTTYISARPSPDVIFRDLNGEAVLLDFGTGRYFGLNPVGTRVWTLLTEGAAVSAIVGIIGAEFDAPLDEIAADVEGLLSELTARGLVIAERSPDPTR